MSKVTLPDIASGYNLSAINSNFQKIEDTLNKEVLYRKEYLGEPNEMQTNLDMNGKQILNATTGASDGSLATKGYVDQGLALKFDKSGGQLSGSIDMNNNEIINVSRLSTGTLEVGGVPVVPTDLAIYYYNETREALRRSYAEAGYKLVDGSFEVEGTLTSASDVLLHEASGKAYSGAGPFPQDVAAGTNPVGGGFVDRSHETLRNNSATGISLSRLMHLPTPLETGLELHRQLGVELIIDCDCQYSYMLIKPGDNIRAVGWPILTKIDNGVPSIAATQAPERPVGYLDSFNVNAFFVVYHEANTAAGHIRISGGLEFMAGPSITLERFAHIPRLAFSHITEIRMQSQYASTTMDGIQFKDEYTNTIGDILLVGAGQGRYGFLWEDFHDGNYYGSGTSTNGYGLHAVNFRRPFRWKWHNYSEFTVCGGESVGIKDELGAAMQPLVFDVEDSLINLGAPSAEGLYGSFIKVSRTTPLTPANCIINNPQANASIYGSKDDTTCKLIHVTGGAEVVINGGFMTQAAAGYNLHFGGAATDSVLQCNGLHTDFIIDSIRNDPANYGGCHEFNGQMLKFMTKMWGRTGPYSIDGQIPFEHTEYDPYALKTGYSSVTIRRGGFYSVKGSIRTSDADGYLTIKFNGTERARTYFTQSPTTSGDQASSYIDFDGFIDSGVVVSLEVHFDNSGVGVIVGNAWYDNKFTVELK